MITIAGKTIAEKIFSAHSGTDAYAHDIVIADVDFVMGQDGTSPLAIRALENMGVHEVFDPSKVALVMDHSSPSPIEGVSALHTMMREFGKKTGCTIYDVGRGRVSPAHPRGRARSAGRSHGGLRLATHAPTGRSTSSRPAWAPPTERPRWPAGKLWFKVPETMKVDLQRRAQARRLQQGPHPLPGRADPR